MPAKTTLKTPAKKPTKNIVRGRPFDADGNATRIKILLSARECFSLHGYANATNKMIADAAGISASALYNYFPSKADMYFAVLEDCEQFAALLYSEAIAGESSPLKALVKILDRNISLHGKYPEMTMFFGHIRSEIIRNPELATYVDNRESQTEKIFRDLIQKAQAAGELSKAVPASNIENMLFGCVLGMTVYDLRMSAEEHRDNMRAFRMLVSGELVGC